MTTFPSCFFVHPKFKRRNAISIENFGIAISKLVRDLPRSRWRSAERGIWDWRSIPAWWHFLDCQERKWRILRLRIFHMSPFRVVVRLRKDCWMRIELAFTCMNALDIFLSSRNRILLAECTPKGVGYDQQFANAGIFLIEIDPKTHRFENSLKP